MERNVFSLSGPADDDPHRGRGRQGKSEIESNVDDSVTPLLNDDDNVDDEKAIIRAKEDWEGLLARDDFDDLADIVCDAVPTVDPNVVFKISDRFDLQAPLKKDRTNR